MTAAGAVYSPLDERPLKGTVCLFDVDNTLGPARRDVSPEMQTLLSQLRHKCAIGYVVSGLPTSHSMLGRSDSRYYCVPESLQAPIDLLNHIKNSLLILQKSGSDLAKQQEQLGKPNLPNGLTAFVVGKELASASFIGWIGEDKYKALVNWTLKYIADLDIPVKRGTFMEFRNGMVNISPIGRNASNAGRDEYQKYDLKHGIRTTMVEAMKTQFPDFGLTYSIGGQISFDVFPSGWDKTYCLQHMETEKDRSGVVYDKIHFFGGKCEKGGNDHEIYADERTIGHSVANPEDTMKQLRELFDL